MAVRLTKEQREVIAAHGERTYNHECCGALLGRTLNGLRVVEEVVPIENSRKDSKHNRYLISPKDLLGVEREARRTGLDRVGIYHSHPDHPARPSQFDLDHCPWPHESFVIVSIPQGKAADLRSYTMREDRSAFDEEEIIET